MTRVEPVDRTWDDKGLISDDLPPDSEYLFARMTEETLAAVEAGPGEKVLDVGCGRGLDLLRLFGQGAVLFGFDGSQVMIELSAGNFKARGVAPRLACGSAEHLPFADSSFDKVVCKGAIDHFYDPRLALQEMVRVVRPGGRVVVSVANFDSLGFRLGKAFDRFRQGIPGWNPKRPRYYEKPRDHVFEFSPDFLIGLVPPGSRVDRFFGLSMFWYVPRWGRFLRVLPRGLAFGLLRLLDKAAHARPSLGDVLVLRLKRLPEPEAEASPATKEATVLGKSRMGVPTMSKYSRVQGLALCLGTFLAAFLFLVGVFTKNWWALAIPVGIGFLWLLGLGFWIGWTLLTIQVEPQAETGKE